MDYDYPPPNRRGRDDSTPPSALLLPVLALLLLAAGAVWWFFGGRPAPQPLLDPAAEPRPVEPSPGFTTEEQVRIDLFESTKDSVVNVDTLAVRRDFDFRLIEQQQGTGSGFIWDTKGYVVTNFHVIQAAVLDRGLNIRVRLSDRSDWNARLVGAAPEFDLAVLQIDTPASRLKPIRVGSSSDLRVGQDAFAIGNPFGQNLTLTSGIISALDRAIQSPADRVIEGVIQTDAALNPGNSGGPLLDRGGRLIGVNTAITSPTGASAGIGYAVPVDSVNRVVPQLIRRGRIPTPTLGIVPVREQITRGIGFETGVLIQDVRPNGPADKAGLIGVRQEGRTGRVRLGDLILTVEGEPVRTGTELNRLIEAYQVGDTVMLTVARDGDEREVEVTLEGV